MTEIAHTTSSDKRTTKINAVEYFDKYYGKYGLFTLSDRAVPSIRDGLKPVQRRFLYQAYKDKVFHDKSYVKSAKLASSTVGNFHPHNPGSVYGAACNLTVPWIQVPLIDGKGSFGICFGDEAAADRYTEMRLSPLGEMFVKPLTHGVVPMVESFSGQDMEPVFLPAPFPNLLVNGAEGIAVGYATKIPQHNPLEVLAAVETVLEKKNKATVDDVLAVMPAPDWATGGTIIEDKSDIRGYYETGRGTVVVRGTLKSEGKTIIVSELPYGVSAEKLRKDIVSGIQSGVITTVSDVSDLSDMRHGLRVQLKPRRGANLHTIEAELCAATCFESSFGVNMVAVDEHGVPHQYSVMDVINEFIAMRHDVIIRQADVERGEKLARQHIIEGLLKVVLDIDRAIRIIRESRNYADAMKQLQGVFDIDKVQAEYVLGLQLRKLTSQDRVELEREAKRIVADIARLERLLSSERARVRQIVAGLGEVRGLLGECARRTSLGGEAIATPKKTVEKTAGGEWFIHNSGVASPVGGGVPLSAGVGYVVWGDGRVKVFAGKGLPKRMDDTPVAPDVSGVVSAGVVPTGDDVIIVTRNGRGLRINPTSMNPQGIAGNGVAGIKLNENDTIVAAFPINDKCGLLTVSDKSWKLTNAADIPTKGRGGSGVILHPLLKGDNGVHTTEAGINPTHNGKKVEKLPRAKRPIKGNPPNIQFN